MVHYYLSDTVDLTLFKIPTGKSSCYLYTYIITTIFGMDNGHTVKPDIVVILNKKWTFILSSLIWNKLIWTLPWKLFLWFLPLNLIVSLILRDVSLSLLTHSCLFNKRNQISSATGVFIEKTRNRSESRHAKFPKILESSSVTFVKPKKFPKQSIRHAIYCRTFYVVFDMRFGPYLFRAFEFINLILSLWCLKLNSSVNIYTTTKKPWFCSFCPGIDRNLQTKNAETQTFIDADSWCTKIHIRCHFGLILYVSMAQLNCDLGHLI